AARCGEGPCRADRQGAANRGDAQEVRVVRYRSLLERSQGIRRVRQKRACEVDGLYQRGRYRAAVERAEFRWDLETAGGSPIYGETVPAALVAAPSLCRLTTDVLEDRARRWGN